MATDIIKQIRRFIVFTLGGIFLIVALLLISLPGPGILLTFLALAFIATKFIWAARLACSPKKEAHSMKDKMGGLFKTKKE